MSTSSVISGHSVTEAIPREHRSLLLIMTLPLLDGVFLTLVLSGGLSSIVDAIVVGSVIIGGGTTVGIIISEFDQNSKTSICWLFVNAVIVGIIAVTQATTATAVRTVLNTQVLTVGAVVMLYIIALQVLPTKRTDDIVSPIKILIVFLALSIEPSQLSEVRTVTYDPMIGMYTLVSVLTAFVISVITVLLKPLIVDSINENTLKYATSAGLATISVSIIGIIPSYVAILVFIITLIIAELLQGHSS